MIPGAAIWSRRSGGRRGRDRRRRTGLRRRSYDSAMSLSTCIAIVLSAGCVLGMQRIPDDGVPGEIDPGCGQPPTGSAGAAVPPTFDGEVQTETFDGDALLDRLERAGEEMRRFEAALTLIRFDGLLEESETRLGEVLLVRDDAGGTRVAVVHRSGALAVDVCEYIVMTG